MDKIQLRGLSTISFYADDHAAAKQWYAEILGMEPYFNVPGYAEFRLGDYQQELGIIDGNYAPKDGFKGTGGAIAYWHVENLPETLDFLLSKGARSMNPLPIEVVEKWLLLQRLSSIHLGMCWES